MFTKFVLPLVAAGILSSQTITTFAGNGTAGFSGDGGQATQAQINRVVGLVADAAGNLYLAEENNNRVRKVDTSGVITTFAGTGVAGFSGDGGQATQAQLNGPLGLCVAPSGDMYVMDQGNKRVRKITASGTITTVAGNGSNVNGGDGGPATGAGMVIPIRCAVDQNSNLFIVDQGAHRIRKVDTGGVITTYAGNGSQGFSGDSGSATQAAMNNPTAASVDASGNLYVTDQFNHRIRRIDTSGTIQTVAGNGNAAFSGDGGPATQASLNFPGGIVVDPAGTLFIVDAVNQRVRKVSGGTITTVAGTGTAGSTGDGGPAAQAQIDAPFAITLDKAGNLYVGEIAGNRVRKISGAAAGGGTTLPPGINYYLSHLAFSGGWQSTLTYVNYSQQQVTCTTNFYSDSGSPQPIPFSQGTISTRTDTIPPGGSVHDQTTASLAAPVAQGWAQASCTGAVQASLLFRFYNSSGVPTSEAGVNAETASTTKFATFAQTNTGVAYANPSTTDSATITITVYSAAGTQLGSKVITLGPLAHGAANLVNLGFPPFTGFVKITSTIPIISLSLNAEAFPAFSALPPGDLPGSTVLVP